MTIKKKNDFISKIAQTSNLNDLQKNEPAGKEIHKEEEEAVNDDLISPVVEEQDNSIEIVKEEVKNPVISRQEPQRKPKSKNNKEFIDNIIALYNEKNPVKNNEKTSLIVTPQLQYKLKMLALSSKVNLYDLTNAIFTSFLEENKEDIEALMKKMM